MLEEISPKVIFDKRYSCRRRNVLVKNRHNQTSENSNLSKYRFLPVLLFSAISFQRATRNRCDRLTDRQNEAPKVQMPRCSTCSMYGIQLADA